MDADTYVVNVDGAVERDGGEYWLAEGVAEQLDARADERWPL